MVVAAVTNEVAVVPAGLQVASDGCSIRGDRGFTLLSVLVEVVDESRTSTCDLTQWVCSSAGMTGTHAAGRHPGDNGEL